MKILICGADGYLGWPLSLYLVKRGHHVLGVDNHSRRETVDQIGSQSAIPIYSIFHRIQILLEKEFDGTYQFTKGELTDYIFVKNIFEHFKPEVVVHLGEIPSAPYSMKDAGHAVWTQINNITGTLYILYAMKDICPDAHLVKLGTMGEYGTPNVDIPEGFFPKLIINERAEDHMPFPKQAGSWYHQSKVHDSNNITMACRLWSLKSTDIMQGVVYGTKIDEMCDDERLNTRLDFDECFGTVINRFCCQAVIGEPLTLYGKGYQKRGFLPLRDSMQCLNLTIENPPEKGEYRVFNQFEGVYILSQLAEKVKKVGEKLNLSVIIKNLENPRKEKESHYYNPEHKHLLKLGYRPTHDMETELEIMLIDLMKYKDRIEAKKQFLIPCIHWCGLHRKVDYLKSEQLV